VAQSEAAYGGVSGWIQFEWQALIPASKKSLEEAQIAVVQELQIISASQAVGRKPEQSLVAGCQ
jgi:hypothetical protein